MAEAQRHFGDDPVTFGSDQVPAQEMRGTRVKTASAEARAGRGAGPCRLGLLSHRSRTRVLGGAPPCLPH